MALSGTKKQQQNTPGAVKTLQQSMGIAGPNSRPGRGTATQTIPESLGLGRTMKRRAPKLGRNHLRDSMGL